MNLTLQIWSVRAWSSGEAAVKETLLCTVYQIDGKSERLNWNTCLQCLMIQSYIHQLGLLVNRSIMIMPLSEPVYFTRNVLLKPLLSHDYLRFKETLSMFNIARKGPLTTPKRLNIVFLFTILSNLLCSIFHQPWGFIIHAKWMNYFMLIIKLIVHYCFI